MKILDDNSGRRAFKRYVIMRLLTYIVVNGFLVFVNYMTGPRYWWVLWVIAGWGIALALDLINKWYRMDNRS